MVTIAYVSRVVFALLGLPLTVFGIVLLWTGFTSDGMESWSDIAASVSVLMMACLCLTTAFAAQVVVQIADRK